MTWIIVRTKRTAWINISLCCIPVSHQFTLRCLISSEELLKKCIYFSAVQEHECIVNMQGRVIFFPLILNVIIVRPDLKRGRFRSQIFHLYTQRWRYCRNSMHFIHYASKLIGSNISFWFVTFVILRICAECQYI